MEPKLRFLFSFFTVWCNVLYIIYLQMLHYSSYTIPNYVTYSLIGMLNIIGIMGSFVILYKGDVIKKKLNISNRTLFLANLIYHIIPMVHILYYRSDLLKLSQPSNNTFIKSALLFHIITLIYMYFNNLTKVYFGINQYILMFVPPVIYWITMIILYVQQ
jgi:hypothetical protein